MDCQGTDTLFDTYRVAKKTLTVKSLHKGSSSREATKVKESTMLDISRVQKELVEIERDKKLSGVSIQVSEDDLTRMRGTISGPVGTPYEGGIFTVDIQLPCEFSSCLLYPEFPISSD